MELKRTILLLLITGGALHADITTENTAQPTDALQLATSFQQNQQAANAQYRGKRIVIKGIVKKVARGISSSPSALAQVYLETGPTLPLIKIEVERTDKLNDELEKEQYPSYYMWKSHVDYKLVDNALEAKVIWTATETGYRNIRPTNRQGQPQVIVRAGDTITAEGVCTGKMIDIVIAHASL